MGRPVSSLVTVRNSSCGKVMFSQASLILSTGRGWGSGRHPPPGQTPPGRPPPPWADTQPGKHPLGRPPWSDTPWVDAPFPWADTNPLGRHHHLPRSDITPPRQTSPPPPRRLPLQWTVRILLECILVKPNLFLLNHGCGYRYPSVNEMVAYH